MEKSEIPENRLGPMGVGLQIPIPTIEIAVICPPLTILPQIVFTYFWSFPQIVKINLRLPQIVF